jgi:hypothetical protein
MGWLKAIGGLVCVLLGGVWVGQGVGILPGSIMSGQIMWAIIGLVLVIVGLWLIWTFARSRSPMGVTRP